MTDSPPSNAISTAIGSPKKPAWYLHARGAQLPADARIRCPRCLGRGSHAGLALDTCESCHMLEAPCPRHICRICDGSGLVCPACRGDRIVRADLDNPWQYDYEQQVIVCTVCCEGNQVNALKERRAIDRYRMRAQLTIVQPAIEEASE